MFYFLRYGYEFFLWVLEVNVKYLKFYLLYDVYFRYNIFL